MIWVKRSSLPGLGGVPIYDVVTFVYYEITRYDITTRANSMAFSFFIALFPAFIFLLTLIPYLPVEYDVVFILKDSIKGILPTSAEDYLFRLIDDLKVPRGGLMSFGVIAALYFGSNGTLSLIVGFEKSYKISFLQRNILQKRWVAVKLTLMMMVLMLLTVALIILGEQWIPFLLDFLHLDAFTRVAINVLKYTILLSLFYTVITVIYRYGPAFINKTGFFTPGAFLATVLSILTSVGFSYYINNYGRYNQLYGAIGTLIVVLLWLQINAFILIMGYELNASIRVNKDAKTQKMTYALKNMLKGE